MDLLPKEFICIQCQDVLVEPHQSFCGFRLCKIHLDSIEVCPFCEKNHPYFPDKMCEREIGNTIITCRFSAEGCPWIGEYRDFQKHMQECDCREVLCEECNTKVMLNKMEDHKKRNEEL